MARDNDWTTQWLDAEDPEEPAAPPRRRSDAHRGSPARRRAVLIAASLPWLVVVLLLVLPGRFGDARTSAPDRPAAGTGSPPSPERTDTELPRPHTQAVEVPADEQATEEDPPDPLADTGTSQEPPAMTELRGAWRVEPGDDAAAVLAVAVARAWLTGIEPRLEIVGLDPPPSDGYVEHLTVESVERISADAAVVTVAAIVLEGDEQLHAGLHRLAVPIGWSDGQPQPAGAPWPLPTPQLQVHDPPPGEPVTDPDVQLAAVAAVEDAGFTEVELLDLESGPAGSVAFARVLARAATGQSLETTVWLRHHLDGFVVAGTALQELGARSSPPHSAGEVDG